MTKYLLKIAYALAMTEPEDTDKAAKECWVNIVSRLRDDLISSDRVKKVFYNMCHFQYWKTHKQPFYDRRFDMKALPTSEKEDFTLLPIGSYTEPGDEYFSNFLKKWRPVALHGPVQKEYPVRRLNNFIGNHANNMTKLPVYP